MKNKFDPRHLKRIANVQALFAWSCGNNEPHTEDTKNIIKHISKIDKTIATNAPKWPLDKINKVDLNILRYAFWELFYLKKNPEKVVIDEVIEIAKEYGTESSSAFVNGVIGSALKNKNESTT
ncbi:MAG: transcription antitermination factor NusB [Candidatus Shapirobacteria bacterium]|nr:transcription antitermination factor NusB [Candidatus Shapirobacteria bacterium]